MSNQKKDYPYPPHYYNSFTTKDALKPPDLKDLATYNKECYIFSFPEKFNPNFYDGEKIIPYYLQDREDLTMDKPLSKDILKLLIGELHSVSVDYIKALGNKTEDLKIIKDKLDNLYYNIFYFLKKIRVKYQARHNLCNIYKQESGVREDMYNQKKIELEQILQEINDCKNLVNQNLT